MNILVLGSGGREHAIAWALAKSPKCEKLYVAPGNGGTAGFAQNVKGLSAEDGMAVLDFVETNGVDLVVIGPEAPLVAGVADVLRKAGTPVFGPDSQGAQLEGSKTFCKEFMMRNNLPTADYLSTDDEQAAHDYIDKMGAPIVVKADGQAAGEGVIVAMKAEEAEEAIKACFSGTFGQAGARVLLEECLIGEEASIIALCDGKTIKPLASSQDHKRALDGDLGPNTGGMGAYSPAPVVTDAMWKIIDEKVLQPFLKGVQKDGLNFRGIIYAGLMITKDGPKILEFNVRFGDPETQAILMRLDSDLVEALCAVADGRLADVELRWSAKPAVCVVMASAGYPGSYEKGKVISGLDEAEATGAVVFHAGTKLKDGKIVTSGGRVLGVTALGVDVADAVKNAYKAVAKISWEGVQYRKDIAHKALNR